MKPSTVICALVVAELAMNFAGCGGAAKTDATQPLQQSFQTAEPEVKKTIETVNTSLRSGNYAEATKALAPLVTGRPLTDPQKQAVGLALQQVNQAIAVNPGLDTKEMYDLRLKMFEAVHRGPRF